MTLIEQQIPLLAKCSGVPGSLNQILADSIPCDGGQMGIVQSGKRHACPSSKTSRIRKVLRMEVIQSPRVIIQVPPG